MKPKQLRPNAFQFLYMAHAIDIIDGRGLLINEAHCELLPKNCVTISHLFKSKTHYSVVRAILISFKSGH